MVPIDNLASRAIHDISTSNTISYLTDDNNELISLGQAGPNTYKNGDVVTYKTRSKKILEDIVEQFVEMKDFFCVLTKSNQLLVKDRERKLFRNTKFVETIKHMSTDDVNLYLLTDDGTVLKIGHEDLEMIDCSSRVFWGPENIAREYITQMAVGKKYHFFVTQSHTNFVAPCECPFS